MRYVLGIIMIFIIFEEKKISDFFFYEKKIGRENSKIQIIGDFRKKHENFRFLLGEATKKSTSREIFSKSFDQPVGIPLKVSCIDF